MNSQHFHKVADKANMKWMYLIGYANGVCILDPALCRRVTYYIDKEATYRRIARNADGWQIGAPGTAIKG